MDSQTVWALLRLGLAGVALCTSLLLWYVQHFLGSLREAERDSPSRYMALLRSPRTLGLMCGVIFVVSACLLSGGVAWSAFESRSLCIPLWSSGFYLLLLCIGAPALGAVGVGIVVLLQVGWFTGLVQAFANLSPRGRASTLDLGMSSLGASLEPVQTFRDLAVNEATRSSWRGSLTWVKSSERKWKLGRDFLGKNREVLSCIVHLEASRLLDSEADGDLVDLEERVASRISQILDELGAYESLVLGRPVQLSRAACALYAEMVPQIPKGGSQNGR